MPDRYQIAKYLMQGEDYYIGFNSALRIHGIISQHAGRDFLVTKRQMRPSTRLIGGIRYQFIKHEEFRFFGYCKMWINQLEKAMVSDLEKTIVEWPQSLSFVGVLLRSEMPYSRQGTGQIEISCFIILQGI